MTLVFVYGTLKQGFPNHATNRGRRVAGTATTVDPWPLYLVSERSVPWLIDRKGGGVRVTGELYEVDDDALVAMDRLERIDASTAIAAARSPCHCPAATHWRRGPISRSPGSFHATRSGLGHWRGTRRSRRGCIGGRGARRGLSNASHRTRPRACPMKRAWHSKQLRRHCAAWALIQAFRIGLHA